MLETFDGSQGFLGTSRTIKRERIADLLYLVSHDNKQKLKELYEVNLFQRQES